MKVLPQITRRTALTFAAAAPMILKFGAAQAASELKISHQFPGGTIDQGDFRDRLCRKFAEAISAQTKGELKGTVYPGASLMKVNAQFSAMRKGALDLSLFPLSYAGGELPEVNIGLMPALVTTYAEGLSWKKKPIGQELQKFLQDKGIVIVSWVWQAGGVASKTRAMVTPEDAKGMKIRGGSREMDLMLQAAGASVLNTPSNELYAAMQTGACDAAITSSTSLISFRLEEIAKFLTSGRQSSYWFMFEPLLMSKQIFDALPKAQQDVIMAAGLELEKFGQDGAAADDINVAKVYGNAGAKVTEFTPAIVDQWKAIARETAWKDYTAKNESCAKFMKLAIEANA